VLNQQRDYENGIGRFVLEQYNMRIFEMYVSVLNFERMLVVKLKNKNTSLEVRVPMMQIGPARLKDTCDFIAQYIRNNNPEILL